MRTVQLETEEVGIEVLQGLGDLSSVMILELALDRGVENPGIALALAAVFYVRNGEPDTLIRAPFPITNGGVAIPDNTVQAQWFVDTCDLSEYVEMDVQALIFMDDDNII